MLYLLVKYLVRLGLKIYFRKIVFSKKELLNEKGPLLLACNHPNSFLDALIIGAYFKEPVHFLARGDAFKNPIAKKILNALRAIPIYRLSEGKEYLTLNDNTFDTCIQILSNGGIVLIFSEGLCLNQWKLRPLKKGTARIALQTWKHQVLGKSFKILPVCLNYSSFTKFNKKLIINLRKSITLNNLSKEKNEGEQIIELNKLLTAELEEGMMISNDNNDIVVIQFLLANIRLLQANYANAARFLKSVKIALSPKAIQVCKKLNENKLMITNDLALLVAFFYLIVFFIPAVMALALHLPLYIPLNNFIVKKTAGTVFYHSALFGALLLLYPLYTLLLSIIFCAIFKNALFLLLILVLPLSARIYLIWKDSLEGIQNYFLLKRWERKLLIEGLKRPV